MTLPYFEGDFWPNIIEDCIRDADKEDNERKRQEDTQQQQFDDDDDDIFEGADSSKKNRYSLSFNTSVFKPAL